MATTIDIVRRFNPPPTPEFDSQRLDIQTRFYYLAEYLNLALPDGRTKSTSLTQLESAAMWAIKAVGENVFENTPERER